MFIPFHDANPLVSIGFQRVTVGLIVLNSLIFLALQGGLVNNVNEATVITFAVVPTELLQGVDHNPALIEISEEVTLVTYMFLHGGWMHLIANMLFLWVFGDNVEDAMGHSRFLIFYILCGIAAGLAHSWAVPDSRAPLIGASGAIAGVTGAYLILYPRTKVWVLILMRLPIRLQAVWVLGAWFVVQIASVAAADDSNVAWWAHIGGFIAGLVLVFAFKRKSVPLFGPEQDPAPR